LRAGCIPALLLLAGTEFTWEDDGSIQAVFSLSVLVASDTFSGALPQRDDAMGLMQARAWRMCLPPHARVTPSLSR
jgi:hypothetical protein